MDKAFQKRDKVLFIAQDTGRTLAQAAIQFVLTEGQVAAVLPNIVTKAQLVEFTKATEVSPINAEELAELHRLYDEEFQALEAIQPQRG